MSLDPGLALVEHLREAFRPDASYFTALESGFVWWPYRLLQRVRAEAGPTGSAGTRRVHAEMLLAERIEGGGEALATIARWNSRELGLSAVRWDAESGALSLRSSVYFQGAQWEGAGQRLAHAALLQLSAAERAVESLLPELNAEPARSHADGGTMREIPDALLEAWKPYAERGREPSPWDGAAFQHLGGLQPPPWLRVNLRGPGLDAELPCTRPGSAGQTAGPGTGVALLRLIGSQTHPRLGSGLIVALQLPPDAEPRPDRQVATAALLNEAESREWTECDQLGAWCVHPSQGLMFGAFHPALSFRDDTLELQSWQSAKRARWAYGFLAQVATLREQSTIH
ncbi:MAG: hypothetical protein ABIU54_13600 [Candidatus Eisenbacteria bacterium]